MPIPPGAPHGLTVTAQGATDVVLRWIDGSTNEAGFLIELLVDGVFEPVMDAPANTTQIVFPLGQPSTAYTFQVRAFSDVLLVGTLRILRDCHDIGRQSGVMSGVVFHDANRNGRADVGEVPAANLVVYHDINGNGVLDELVPPLVAAQVTVSSVVRTYPGTNLPYVGTVNYVLRNLPFGSRRILRQLHPTNTRHVVLPDRHHPPRAGPPPASTSRSSRARSASRR